MTPEGMSVLARYISVSQGREFTAADMDVWLDALDGLDDTVALDACRALVKETSDFITPARVRERYSRIAAARLQQAADPDLPDGLDAGQYTVWLREYRRLLITGCASEDANREALRHAGVNPDERLGVRSRVELPLIGAHADDGDDVVVAELIE